MLKQAAIFVFLVPALIGCGESNKEKKSSEASSQQESKKPPADLGNGDEKKPEDPNKPGAHKVCQVDKADGKNYCLDINNEVPSDVDPTRKLKKCEKGFLDGDACKPMHLFFHRGLFRMFIGDSVRVQAVAKPERDGEPQVNETIALDKMKLQPEGGMKKFSYNYPSKYDRTGLDSLGPVTVSKDHYTIRGQQPTSLEPISVTYLGVAFETGPIELSKFWKLCKDITYMDNLRSGTFGDYPWEIGWDTIKENRYGCTKNGWSLSLKCNKEDGKCSIYDVSMPYYKKAWFDASL